MTKRELNRDIKRLAKAITSKDEMTYNEQEEFRREFKRLIFADRDFSLMTKKSILIMLRINLMHRFHALHWFGLDIDLKKLI